jgi:hypothetical protein
MTLFASCEKRNISKNIQQRVPPLFLSSTLIFKMNFSAKTPYFISMFFCEKSRHLLKSEKLKNVQLGDKCGRKITPSGGFRSLQTYRHYSPFFWQYGLPRTEKALTFTPVKQHSFDSAIFLIPSWQTFPL